MNSKLSRRRSRVALYTRRTGKQLLSCHDSRWPKLMSTAQRVDLIRYLRSVPPSWDSRSAYKTHSRHPAGGLVQWIFSSPAPLDDFFASHVPFAAELKILCITKRLTSAILLRGT